MIILLFRCGMVYVDPGQLGWKPYVTSWLQRVGGKLKQDAQVPCVFFLLTFSKISVIV